MASTGLTLPTVGASTSRGGSETGPWTNPGNITLDDGSFATDSITASSDWTPYLKGTGFGFAIPSGSTINGITLEINRKSSAANLVAADDLVSLVKAGTVTGSNKAIAGAYPTTLTVATYGSSSDLWGTSWTDSDINDTNFGAVLSFTQGLNSDANASVDSFKINVYYTASGGANQGIMF